jgi:alkylation response protein AidB-like acyl-CoA dehydrogenase
MRQMEKSVGHVNCFLPEGPALFEDALGGMRETVTALCETPFDTSNAYFRAVLEARLAASDWSLRAAQAAMLHSGARGYLANAPAQRRLRESYFVAIVTPATKQLLKMLAELED